MTQERALTVLVALFCIVCLGVSATAIESSLATHPDDVIDLDYQYLPFDEDFVQSFKLESWRNAGRRTSPPEHQQTNRDQPPPAVTPTQAAHSASPPTMTPVAPQTATPSPIQTATPATEQPPKSSAPHTDTPSPAHTVTSSATQTATPDGRNGSVGDVEGNRSTTPLSSAGRCRRGPVLGLLAPVLPMEASCGPLLPLLVALGVVLVAVALGYRYRTHLPGVVLPLEDNQGGPTRTGAGPTGTDSAADWPHEPPSNEVQRAWLTMVRRANPDRPWTRTPSECASAAVAAGVDPHAVDTLTRLFEEVRYAGAPVTDERRQQAQVHLQRLDESGES